MIVTKHNYYMEKSMVSIMDQIAERLTGKGNQDAVLLCEGAEGDGKTTMSIAVAFYVAEKTNREFSEKQVFFDVEKMIEYAQNNEKKIIIWDEPALQALSTDWASKCVKNLSRLLMMARKKRHFIIINMTKFYKFNEYIIVDRSIGMIHVYSQKNIKPGFFVYIKRDKLESLWRDYRFGKRRNYKKYYARKIHGKFPNVLSSSYKGNVLSEFDNASYEKAKDKAIMMIGADTKKDNLDNKDIERLQLYDRLKEDGKTDVEAAKLMGMHVATLYRMKKRVVVPKYLAEKGA